MSKILNYDNKPKSYYVEQFKKLVESDRNKEKKEPIDQFKNNDILTIESTKKNIFFLLKNGEIIFYEIDKRGRLVYSENVSKLIPDKLNLKTKLVDLVCGKFHCLAKGINNKIYSWGSNSHGQLGLGDKIKEYLDYPLEIDSENFDVSIL